MVFAIVFIYNIKIIFNLVKLFLMKVSFYYQCNLWITIYKYHYIWLRQRIIFLESFLYQHKFEECQIHAKSSLTPKIFLGMSHKLYFIGLSCLRSYLRQCIAIVISPVTDHLLSTFHMVSVRKRQCSKDYKSQSSTVCCIEMMRKLLFPLFFSHFVLLL